MNYRPAIRTGSGLTLVADVATHSQVLLLAQQEGIDVNEPAELGWLDWGSYRQTPRSNWPGLECAGHPMQIHR